MAVEQQQQSPKSLYLAEPAPASKSSAPKWVDVEAVKPAAAGAASAEAAAANARRRRAFKVALGVGTGILVALFVALTVALAVTYAKRDCGNGSGNPGSSSGSSAISSSSSGQQASTSEASSQGSSSATSNPTTRGGGSSDSGRVSRFRQGADTVALTPMTAALIQELGVESWAATTTEAMTTLNAKWDKDHDVYIKSGKVMITWFVTIENLGGSPGTSVAETAMVEAGQLITVPANVKTTWTYIRTTEALTKVYA